jgi:hypothetical protein
MARNITRSFNVLLTLEESQALDQCADRLGTSRGTSLRWALARMHRMIVLGIPTCASGQTCYVPHMHPAAAMKQPDIPGQTITPATLTTGA